MVDYSKWDQLVAQISSSDDCDDDSQHNNHETIIMRDKFNPSNKTINKSSTNAKSDDDYYKLPTANNDINDEDIENMNYIVLNA